MKIIILLLVALSQSVFAQESTQLPDSQAQRKASLIRYEKSELKFGGSVPFTWNASFELVLAKSGLRTGVLAQGPHDRYMPMIIDAKPSVTTYGALLGWGYTKWQSIIKGSGAYVYGGTGSTQDKKVTSNYNYGYVIQLVGTLTSGATHGSFYDMGVFVQYKHMFQVLTMEEGILSKHREWTERQNLTSVNFGVAVHF
ncbi:MAG: hypothetical protein KBB70_01195 [Candidatus Pacebacteria bacterium]|nr:hypothetical protein [Candidatus Paceibacterota bacterium]